MRFIRQEPTFTLEKFLAEAVKVGKFTSSTGKKYEVKYVKDDIMHFIRKDADAEQDWSFDLKDVYKAYIKLEKFDTIAFKKFVPRKHSPARGLLLHLKLLTVDTGF